MSLTLKPNELLQELLALQREMVDLARRLGGTAHYDIVGGTEVLTPELVARMREARNALKERANHYHGGSA